MSKKDSIYVTFERSYGPIVTKILSITDTLITCTTPSSNIPSDDYEVILHAGRQTFNYMAEHLKLKVIIGNPEITTIIPAAANIGGKITITANIIGSSTPGIFFGGVEATITQYLQSYYPEYWSDQIHYYDLKKNNGFVSLTIPVGASTPIILRTDCGDLDITKNLTVLPSNI